MKRSGITTITSNPYGNSTHWSLCLVALFVGAAALLVAFYARDGRLLTGGVGTAFFLCGLGMLVRRNCAIDWKQRMVVLEYKLFGKFTLRCKEILISEFDRIVITQHGSSDKRICLVSLLKRSGGKVALRYFDAVEGRVCYSSKDFAERLASDLGLEITDCQQPDERSSLF